ncbi:MAG: iron hydrogenase small subunit, partial [Oscillospiraceae bacterium]|nr:iron hydrogenase small subunit [Oscillospiraceae bacterium]
SHDNPVLQEIYKDYLGEAGGHKAHELLHTHYIARPRYQ